MASEPDRYDVGYKKPPKHTRFQAGQSGNPKGRPKGCSNFATTLGKILGERVQIVENGRRKTITKLEATMKQLVNKSASGDLKAIQVLSSFSRELDPGLDPRPKEADLAADMKVIASIVERFSRKS